MATSWQLSGNYFENCNCDVVCPCLISPNAQLTSKPTQGVCDVALAFHIDTGNYGDVRLDGLNVAMIAHAPGAMEPLQSALKFFRSEFEAGLAKTPAVASAAQPVAA